MQKYSSNNLLSYRPITGGFFLWVTLPSSLDGVAAAKFLRDHFDIIVLAGINCGVKTERNYLSHSWRITFAKTDDKELLTEAAKRLNEGLLAYIQSTKTTTTTTAVTSAK
jgi:DNA-binding transcriptional MocR family regulator